MNIPAIVIATIAGLLIGGVINALADDLPVTYRLRRIHYRDGEPRPAIAWLGVLAFLTRHRTSPGGAKLTWRYPAVELIMMAFYLYLAFNYGLSGHALYWMGCLAILMLITVIDLEQRLILFVVIIPSCIYALVGAALVAPEISEKIFFRDYVVGGVMGFGIFFAMYLGGILFSAAMASSRGEDLDEVAFGYGDVMLGTLAGFMLGWQALIFAIFIAVFAGAAGALIYLSSRIFIKGEYDLFTALPYGQYIVFGTIIMMLWRTPVINYLQGM
jgi:leader peptidase (prepilin peptidase)/N-methyltransferase